MPISIRRSKYNKWHHSFGMDYLVYVLGNKCKLCERGYPLRLEIDHLLPRRDLFKKYRSSYSQTMQDYENGEPLRVLCEDCHLWSHAFRI